MPTHVLFCVAGACRKTYLPTQGRGPTHGHTTTTTHPPPLPRPSPPRLEALLRATCAAAAACWRTRINVMKIQTRCPAPVRQTSPAGGCPPPSAQEHAAVHPRPMLSGPPPRFKQQSQVRLHSQAVLMYLRRRLPAAGKTPTASSHGHPEPCTNAPQATAPILTNGCTGRRSSKGSEPSSQADAACGSTRAAGKECWQRAPCKSPGAATHNTHRHGVPPLRQTRHFKDSRRLEENGDEHEHRAPK